MSRPLPDRSRVARWRLRTSGFHSWRVAERGTRAGVGADGHDCGSTRGRRSRLAGPSRREVLNRADAPAANARWSARPSICRGEEAQRRRGRPVGGAADSRPPRRRPKLPCRRAPKPDTQTHQLLRKDDPDAGIHHGNRPHGGHRRDGDGDVRRSISAAACAFGRGGRTPDRNGSTRNHSRCMRPRPLRSPRRPK